MFPSPHRSGGPDLKHFTGRHNRGGGGLDSPYVSLQAAAQVPLCKENNPQVPLCNAKQLKALIRKTQAIREVPIR